QATVLAQEQVRGLDVAVDEAGVVRVLQPRTGLHSEVDDPRDRQAACVCEGHAGHVLHDDERTRCFAGVVHPHDVRVREPAGETRLAREACAEGLVVGELLGQHLDRDGSPELLIAGEVDGRHAAVTELELDPVAAGRERLGQSCPSCFLSCFFPCLPCSFAGGAGGTQCTRETSSLTAPESCSCRPAATLPRLIAAIVLCCSRCTSARARHVSPAASAAATASLWVASEEASEREKVGAGGGVTCFAPPHALRQSAAPSAAPSS